MIPWLNIIEPVIWSEGEGDLGAIVHIRSGRLDQGKHVLTGFPFMICPCKPDIFIESDVTWLYHRETQ